MADIKRYALLVGSFSMCRSPNGPYVLHADHEAALKAAVAAEREACAKVADRWRTCTGALVAEKIRERGQT